ncbi:MAG: recombinase A [Candidatus Sericytochromatia bacterium]|nr:recombinase A [Candidatus Sericytochromatia bacterium]
MLSLTGRLASLQSATAHTFTHGPAAWRLLELVGRLAEICGTGASAGMTLAVPLVLEAQRAAEPAAWITTRARSFFPADVSAHGVDLAALAVVRVPAIDAIGRAADQLARSGAFGLLILDLGSADRLPERQASRLLGLAQSHGLAIICLSGRPAGAPSVSPLISVRGEARWRREAPGTFICEWRALKDKRRPPGWSHTELCHGPAGLR